MLQDITKIYNTTNVFAALKYTPHRRLTASKQLTVQRLTAIRIIDIEKQAKTKALIYAKTYRGINF